MDKTNKQKKKSLRDGTRFRNLVVNTLKNKNTKLETIIYTWRAWYRSVQDVCMMLWSLSSYEL